MASEEFEAFQTTMAERPVPPPPANLEELRDRIDANMAGLPLAEGTEAVEHRRRRRALHRVRVVGSGADAPVLV